MSDFRRGAPKINLIVNGKISKRHKCDKQPEHLSIHSMILLKPMRLVCLIAPTACAGNSAASLLYIYMLCGLNQYVGSIGAISLK